MLREVDIRGFLKEDKLAVNVKLCAGLFVRHVQLNERSGRQGHPCEVEVGVL
jgi:hypothetical protein